MLKVGVLGAGHLGKIHLRLLQQSEKYELVGFYDENQEYAEKISKEFGYTNFNTIAKLIHAVDVIDIVTPTLSHYKCARAAIKSGKHVFIEKPATDNPDDTKVLINLAKEAGVIVQVGHIVLENNQQVERVSFLLIPRGALYDQWLIVVDLLSF